jgi:hypothetical protein
MIGGAFVGFFDDIGNAVHDAVAWVGSGAGAISNAFLPGATNLGNIVSNPGKVTADSLQLWKNRAIGSQMNFSTGGLAVIGNTDDAQKFLNSKGANAVSLGAAGDFANYSTASQKFTSGQQATASEVDGSLRFAAKGLAVGAVAGVGAMYGAGGSTYGAAYGGAQAAARGDTAGIVNAGLAGADIPVDPGIVNQIFPRTGGGQSGPTYNLGGNFKYQTPGNSDLGFSTQSGYDSGAQTAQSIAPAVAAIAAVGLFIAYKKGLLK